MQQVVAALFAIHNPATPAPQRLQANQFTEHLKQDPAQCLQAALQLINYQGPQVDIVRHFALHCLEHLCSRGWNGLTAPQKSFVKSQGLTLLQKGRRPEEPTFVREKVASILSAMAIREWPQRWPELMGRLHQLAPLGESQLHMYLLVVRNLAEEVLSFNPQLPIKRRAELRAGLMACMPTIFPSVHSVLSQQLARCKQEAAGSPGAKQARGLVLVALATMASFVEWVAPEFVFGTTFLVDVCSCLSSPTFILEACETLLPLSSRTTKHPLPAMNKMLCTLWHRILQVLAGLVQQQFENKLAILTKLLRIVHNLTKHHHKILSSASAELPEEQLNAIRTANVTILGRLLDHDSLKLTMQSLEISIILFRSASEELLPPGMSSRIAASFFEVCARRLSKIKQAKLLSADEFDTRDAFLRHMSTLRGHLVILIGLLVEIEPVLCTRTTLLIFRQVLSLKATDAKNKAGFATTDSTAYVQQEAAGLLLEHVFKMSATQWQSPELVSVAAQLTSLLLAHTTEDALLKTLQLRSICLVAPLLALQPRLLSGALTLLLGNIPWRPPGQEQAQWHDLSEDVRACRRRAGYSLVRLAKHSATRTPLLQVFKPLCSQVIQLTQRPDLMPGEKTTLMEFLVLVSRGMENGEEQRAFVHQILAQPLATLGRQDVIALLRPGGLFALLIDQGEQQTFNAGQPMQETPCRALRIELDQTFTACFSILKCVFSAKREGGTRPAAALLCTVYPSALRFLAATLMLWDPAVVAKVPKNMQVMYLESQEQSMLVLGAGVTRSLPYHIWKWAHGLVENCFNIVGTAAKTGPPFFQSHKPQDILGLFPLLLHAGHRHIRLFIERVTLHYVNNCPPECVTAYVPPFLHQWLSLMRQRLSPAWAVFQSEEGAANGEQLEVLQNKELRELTRAFCTSWVNILAVQEGKRKQGGGKPAGRRKKKDKQPKNTPKGQESAAGQTGTIPKGGKAQAEEEWKPNAAFQIVITAQVLREALFGLLCDCMRWPDSVSQRKALLILSTLCSHLTQFAPMVNIYVQVLKTALQLLSTLSPDVHDVMHHDLIFLIKEILQTMGGTGMPRQVILHCLPHADPAHLTNLEQSLQTVQAERNHRKACKAFLIEYVIGRNLKYHDTTGHIRDLAEPLVVAKKPKELAPEVVLPNLFE